MRSRTTAHARRVRAAAYARPAAAVAALVLAACSAGGIAHAQTLGDAFSQRADKNSKKADRLLVDASELVYNRDRNTVSAVGEVKLYYQGRVLEAERVVYDRARNRVYAEGNAKLTDETGGVSYAKRFELTDDFKDGFIDSLSSVTKDNTRFAAPRVERIGGETTVFERGTYTACEPCKDDPERPPLWQVRAKRIIHQNSEQMIYYEGARLEFLGVPIAYSPYLSAPDPSVRRKTGFLSPIIMSSSKIGYGAGIPFFWNIAPNYDLTVTPTFLSRQGFLARAEWRHRIETSTISGSYVIRAAGISQNDPKAFDASPWGARKLTNRGYIESVGKFKISDKWSFGWAGMIQSDRWFTTNYRQPSSTVGTTYFKEAVSTAYVTGQGDRGYLDLRGYYFQGLSNNDLQRQQPIVGPLLDYNKTIDLPADRTVIGGQLEIDVNAARLNRDLAMYQSTGLRQLDKVYGLYDICSVYNRQGCILRGVGGQYARVTAQATWKRKFIDPIGSVWTPFAFVRADASWMSLNMSNRYMIGSSGSVIGNPSQAGFFSSSPDYVGRITPGVGMEWRYPFIARVGGGSHIIEPIAQIIARPNERGVGSRPNEDAQSLVFDDTNLFEWNKFSGYDRMEGGVRANIGAQYTGSFANGASINILAGQSFQLSGRNSYAMGDVANVGVNSGLEKRRSDYVGRIAFQPVSGYSFVAKGRFDDRTFALRRLDVGATYDIGSRLSGAVYYSRYTAQPEIGFPFRREGILASARLKLNKNYWVSATTTLDLDRHLADKSLNTKTALIYPASIGLGMGYADECTTFSLNYTNGLQDVVNGTRVRTQTFLMRLELRTLGEVTVRGSSAQQTTGDSIGSTTSTQ